MARCAYCGVETQLFSNGTPICIKCDKAHEPTRDHTPALTGEESASD
jgi:hypothetical protein